jgi:uncharacterized protein (TIGR03435 family)
MESVHILKIAISQRKGSLIHKLLVMAFLLCTASCRRLLQPAPSDMADLHLRPSHLVALARKIGPYIYDGRYIIRNATMLDLISLAYGVNEGHVVNGPSWLEWNRYDLVANAASGGMSEQRGILQRILKDRFNLSIHRDTRLMPAFRLSAVAKVVLNRAGDTTESGCVIVGQEVTAGQIARSDNTDVRIECRNIAIPDFIKYLEGLPPVSQFLNGRPIVDATNLEGAWTFSFKISPYARKQLSPDGSQWPPLLSEIDQLGLKLDAITTQAPVLAVSHVDEVPTPNPPGVDKRLAITPPTTFASVNIRPIHSGVGASELRSTEQGGLIASNLPLRVLIQWAFDIDAEQITGGPPWLATSRYDIVAQAPRLSFLTILRPPNAPKQVDPALIRPMVSAMLRDRFHLDAHIEYRDGPAYSLIAFSPKLHKSAGTRRTRLYEGAAPGKDDLRLIAPARNRLITVENMTLAQFAEALPGAVPAYVHGPVSDETGLVGAWDFMLSFSTASRVAGVGAPVADRPHAEVARAGAALDKSGNAPPVTFFDALEEQLGLRLESRKRSGEVLIIDHIDDIIAR